MGDYPIPLSLFLVLKGSMFREYGKGSMIIHLALPANLSKVFIVTGSA